mmetsp:Transcript_28363/g.80065  ORF Transcript_28363/g.80065 Transcript_28363/m.80065 type:complete len:268 (+) Transcript_28363:162-965(+)|eukprot:CAMPEP_0117666974 /NCGR_PEP_ID=MMETSP0804-20121206/10686_1 /TAXON_ID=1074897 /ORGANISM="Tetraselmis astigmatica, Strain CCMP880" /LENGTH=267 /DNA_ID=CAMNT_0005474603 /DNA_START=81 /DNA_END=884 /DNA_ORIENTATION=+
MLRCAAASLVRKSWSVALPGATGPCRAIAAGLHLSEAKDALIPQPAAWLQSSVFRHAMSTSPEAPETRQADKPGTEAAEEPAEAAQTATAEELQTQLEEQNAQILKLQDELKEAKDKLVYTLADMENLRQRTARQADDAKKFAVQGFVKSILDVADNLERASKAVPDDVLSDDKIEELDVRTARKMLVSMLEGVQLTEKVLLQIFSQNGIQKVDPLGEKFDPNLHQALFEMPDPSREPGTVGTVTKAGYTLHGRVVRPADVGVVREP